MTTLVPVLLRNGPASTLHRRSKLRTVLESFNQDVRLTVRRVVLFDPDLATFNRLKKQ